MVQEYALHLIGAYGPEAKEAVPALIALAKNSTTNYDRQVQVARALGEIGPDAKEAIPVLKEILKENRVNANFNVSFEPQASIQKAIDKIGK